MAELILMRHAAAVPAADGASDFERALSASGRTGAIQAARRLSAEGVSVERLLYSPARRTRDTAAIVAKELSVDTGALESVPELYAASPRTIRRSIERFHGGAQILMLIGHNPGISEFGGALPGGGRHQHLPTAGYWRFPFDAERWQQLTGRIGAPPP